MFKFREPHFENYAGPLELTYGDGNFGIRYANLVSLLTSFEKYFIRKLEVDKIKFTKKFSLKENIQVNEILKGDQKNIILFCEIFLLLSSITTQKDLYIDRVSESEEKYLNGFLNIIEKYVIFETTEVNKSPNCNRKFTARTSILFNYNDNSKTIAAVEKLNKKIEDLDNDKRNLLKTLSINEQDLEDCRDKNKSLSKLLKDSEFKNSDLMREIEMLKNSNEDIMKAHQETYQDVLKIDQFKKQIMEKDMEIEKINSEHKNQIRTYLDKISKLDEVIFHLNHKDEEYLSIRDENEKLKLKNKEFHTLREKLVDHEDLVKKSERQYNIIETINVEKSAMQSEIEKLNSEVFAEKEKFRIVESKNSQLEFEIEEMQNYIDSLKSMYADKSKKPISLFKRAQSGISDGKLGTGNLTDRSEDSKDLSRGKNLADIDQEIIRRDVEKKIGDQVERLNIEIEHITRNKMELVSENKVLQEKYDILYLENNNLKISLDEKLRELEKYSLQSTRHNMEKEKLEILMQKSEIEFKQNLYSLNKEKDDFQALSQSLQTQINELKNEKKNILQDAESVKQSYKDAVKDLETSEEEIRGLKIEVNILEEKCKQFMEKESNRNTIYSVPQSQRNSFVNNGNTKMSGRGTMMDNILALQTMSNNRASTLTNDNRNFSPDGYRMSTMNPHDIPFMPKNSIMSSSGSIMMLQPDFLESALTPLKKELEDLRINQNAKDEIIRQANEKVKTLETENRKLLGTLQDNLEKYTIEINQRAEDLDFLKRAYEDQKSKLSREHDLLTSTIYDMAYQFMSLKEGISTGNISPGNFNPAGSNANINYKRLSAGNKQNKSINQNKSNNFSLDK